MYIEERLNQIEAKLDKLLGALDLLDERIHPAPAPAEPKPTPKAAPKDEKPAEADNAVTKDTLQAYALARVREEGKAFKAALIAALGKYDVKTISQLPDDDAAQAVFAELGGGQ